MFNKKKKDKNSTKAKNAAVVEDIEAFDKEIEKEELTILIQEQNELNEMVRGEISNINSIKESRLITNALEDENVEYTFNNKKYKIVGIILSIIFFLSIGAFSYFIFDLGLLPILYSSVAIGAFFLIGLSIFIIQIVSKRKALISKLISVFLIVILTVSSFYIYALGDTLSAIVGGNVKIDIIRVVVLADDPASNPEDAKNYTIGTSEASNEMISETLTAFEEQVGEAPELVEYSSLGETASALLNSEVDAMIYNNANTSILDESLGDFNTKVKEIFSYEIITELENTSSNIDITDEPFTVMISGIDQYGDISATGLSDVNIIAVVNPKTRSILLVNTPRDMYVELPGISYGAKDKLTHAGIYGVDATMAALAELYDTEVEYYVRLNFTSLITMVDALGGVEVESEYEFTTSTNSGHVTDIALGTNTLNGVEALAFSRERKNVPGGDDTRGRHQQQVITGMIEKAISPAIITGATQILAEVSDNMETNLTEEEIQSLIQDQLTKGLDFNIRSISLTGSGGTATAFSTGRSLVSVTYPNSEEVESISEQIAALRGEPFSAFEMIEKQVIVKEEELEEEELEAEENN